MIKIFRQSVFAILILSFITNLSSCGYTISRATVKDDGNQLPPELGKTKTTMLVIKNDWKKYDKFLEETFQKYYNGNYLLITGKELNEPKYQDSIKYRYVFNTNQRDMQSKDFSNATITSQTTVSGYKYYIVDKKEKKTYASFYSSGWGELMRSYVKKMNEVFEKNGGK